MRGFRVGVVNPFNPFSKRIRELLEERGFPIIELKLFETRADGGSALTEFHEEIVITQPLDEDLFAHLDLIFFGGDDREKFGKKASAAAKEGVLAIVSGSPDVVEPVVAPGLNDRAIKGSGRLMVAARAPSILLGTVLASLAGSFEVRGARATLLLPASDRGEDAIEELHQQVVKILNFQPPPKTIFPEQLAFNVIPNAGETNGLNEIVARESSQLAGIEDGVSVMLVQAPVFHGYAMSLWVRFAEEVKPGNLTKALRTSKKLRLARSGKLTSPIPTPISVAGSNEIHVGWIRRDESTPDAYWLWVVADATALDPAERAIRLAEILLGAPKVH